MSWSGSWYSDSSSAIRLFLIAKDAGLPSEEWSSFNEWIENLAITDGVVRDVRASGRADGKIRSNLTNALKQVKRARLMLKPDGELPQLLEEFSTRCFRVSEDSSDGARQSVEVEIQTLAKSLTEDLEGLERLERLLAACLQLHERWLQDGPSPMQHNGIQRNVSQMIIDEVIAKWQEAGLINDKGQAPGLADFCVELFDALEIKQSVQDPKHAMKDRIRRARRRLGI